MTVLRWPWLRRHLPEPEPEPSPGIELRITTAAGDLVRATSEHLYYMAKYGGAEHDCTPGCLPDCPDRGWYCLVPGPPDMPMIGLMDGREFRVLIRPWGGPRGT